MNKYFLFFLNTMVIYSVSLINCSDLDVEEKFKSYQHCEQSSDCTFPSYSNLYFCYNRQYETEVQELYEDGFPVFMHNSFYPFAYQCVCTEERKCAVHKFNTETENPYEFTSPQFYASVYDSNSDIEDLYHLEAVLTARLMNWEEIVIDEDIYSYTLTFDREGNTDYETTPYSFDRLHGKNILFITIKSHKQLDFSILEQEQLDITAIVNEKDSTIIKRFSFLQFSNTDNNYYHLQLYNSYHSIQTYFYGINTQLFPAVLPWNKIHGTIAGGYGSIYDLKEHYLIGATGDDGITDIQFHTPTPFTYDGNSYVITLFRHYKTIDRPSGELDNKEVLSYFVIDEQLYGE